MARLALVVLLALTQISAHAQRRGRGDEPVPPPAHTGPGPLLSDASLDEAARRGLALFGAELAPFQGTAMGSMQFSGLRVGRLDPNGPAARAGLATNDVIVEVFEPDAQASPRGLITAPLASVADFGRFVARFGESGQLLFQARLEKDVFTSRDYSLVATMLATLAPAADTGVAVVRTANTGMGMDRNVAIGRYTAWYQTFRQTEQGGQRAAAARPPATANERPTRISTTQTMGADFLRSSCGGTVGVTIVGSDPSHFRERPDDVRTLVLQSTSMITSLYCSQNTVERVNFAMQTPDGRVERRIYALASEGFAILHEEGGDAATASAAAGAGLDATGTEWPELYAHLYFGRFNRVLEQQGAETIVALLYVNFLQAYGERYAATLQDPVVYRRTMRTTRGGITVSDADNSWIIEERFRAGLDRHLDGNLTYGDLAVNGNAREDSDRLLASNDQPAMRQLLENLYRFDNGLPPVQGQLPGASR